MITSPPWANPAVLFFCPDVLLSRPPAPRGTPTGVRRLVPFPRALRCPARGGPDTLLLAAHTIDGGLSLSGLLDR